MTALATPAPAAAAPPQDNRTASVFANLLPEEVVAGRRARTTRNYVLIGLVAVVALLIGADGYSWWQTQAAQHTLASSRDQTQSLQSKQASFAPLVTAQAQSAEIGQTISGLMTNDLQWAPLLDKIRAAATGGVSVTDIDGDVTAGAVVTPLPPGVPPSGLPVLNESGKVEIGTLLISGIAPTKAGIAQYTDALTKVPGLAAVFPASVTAATKSFTFTISVIMTSDLLGGRFTPTTTTPATTTTTTGGS